MRKHLSIILPIFTAAGVAGAVLRYIHAATCYDSSGLPVSGSPVTTALFALSVAAAIGAFVLALAVSARLAPKPGFNGAFKIGPVGLVFQLLSAVLMAVSSVLGIMEYGFSSGIFQSAGNLLGILSLVSIAAAAVSTYKGISARSAAYLLILPSAFMCLRLVAVFYANVANPVTLDYSFECVALGAAALYIFSAGGYAIDRPQTFTTVFSGLVAVTFSFIAVTGRSSASVDILCYLSIPSFVIPGLFSFLKGLDAKPAEKK